MKGVIEPVVASIIVIFFLPFIHFIVFLLSRFKKSNLPFYILHPDIYKKLLIAKEDIIDVSLLRFLPFIIIDFLFTWAIFWIFVYYGLKFRTPPLSLFSLQITILYIFEIVILGYNNTYGIINYIKDRGMNFFFLFLVFVFARYLNFNGIFLIIMVFIFSLFQSSWRVRESFLFSRVSGRLLLIFFHLFTLKEILMYLFILRLIYSNIYLILLLTSIFIIFYEIFQIFSTRYTEFKVKYALLFILCFLGVIL